MEKMGRKNGSQGRGQSEKIIRVSPAGEYYTVWATSPVRCFMKPEEQSAEQLLDSKGVRPKGHVLKTPKKPTAEEKIKAAKQRKAIQHDLGK
jgi:hypothetical protein